MAAPSTGGYSFDCARDYCVPWDSRLFKVGSSDGYASDSSIESQAGMLAIRDDLSRTLGCLVLEVSRRR